MRPQQVAGAAEDDDGEQDEVLRSEQHDGDARRLGDCGERPNEGDPPWTFRVAVSPVGGTRVRRGTATVSGVSILLHAHAERRWRLSEEPADGPPGLARLAVDAAFVAVVAAVSLVLLADGGLDLASPRARGLDLTTTLLAVATAVPLFGWRRWPQAAFVTVGAASIAIAARGEAIWPPIGLAAAVYLIVRGRPSSAPWTPTKLAVVVAVLGTYLAFALGEVGELLHSVVALAAAWFAGEVSRLRRAQLAEVRDRAARVGRDAARERDLAVAEERTRIARDLHDSVAHALNVISVRAGAARLRQDPEHALVALAAIEELSRQTMTDIDHVVGTLRTPRSPDEPVEVPPGLAALEALVAEHRAGGHEVELTRSGTPRPLAVPVDHGTFRIVQEALTNATRYGAGTTRVDLSHEPDAIRVTVTNPLLSVPPRTPDSGGHGLIGMRERAHALGGEVSVGPVGGTFQVCARLPYDGLRR